jgi:hypothetical protein
MTSIKIEDDNIVIEMIGIDKVLSLKSRIDIPAKHILSASQNIEESKKWLGIKGMKKILGSNIPGIISDGTFYDHGRFFLDVHNPENTISIILKDEKYKEIIVEVENPQETLELINKKIQ